MSCPTPRLTLEMIVDSDKAGVAVAEVMTAMAILGAKNDRVTIQQAIHAIAVKKQLGVPIENIRIAPSLL
jgi:hypothetical protein